MNVIKYTNLPAKMPLFESITGFILLDSYSLNWVLSSFLVVLLIFKWLFFLVRLNKQIQIEIVFEDKKKDKGEPKPTTKISKFQEKLEEAIELGKTK